MIRGEGCVSRGGRRQSFIRARVRKRAPKSVIAAQWYARLVVHVGDPHLLVEHVRVVAHDHLMSAGTWNHVSTCTVARRQRAEIEHPAEREPSGRLAWEGAVVEMVGHGAVVGGCVQVPAGESAGALDHVELFVSAVRVLTGDQGAVGVGVHGGEGAHDLCEAPHVVLRRGTVGPTGAGVAHWANSGQIRTF